MEPTRSSLTLANVMQIFKQQGWRYAVYRDTGLLTSFNDVTMLFLLDEDRDIVLMLVPAIPGKGMEGYRNPKPQEAERDIGNYLSAVNYRLVLGAWTRDHRDGEIRFEVSIPVPGTFLSDEQIALVIEVAVRTYKRRLPVIQMLLYEQLPLSEALEWLETGEDPPVPAAG